MKNISLDEYLYLVKKNFEHLFLKYGFKEVLVEEDGRLGSYIIGVESDKIKAVFVREIGMGAMFVGPLSAKYTSQNISEMSWVNVLSLLYYLQKRSRLDQALLLSEGF